MQDFSSDKLLPKYLGTSGAFQSALHSSYPKKLSIATSLNPVFSIVVKVIVNINLLVKHSTFLSLGGVL
jgi:hypothetical protein